MLEKKTYEFQFKTNNVNAEDPLGNWFNYYDAETEDEALEMFFQDIESMKPYIQWYQIITIRNF